MLVIRSDSRMTNLLTIAGIMLIAVAIFMAWGTFGTVSKTGFDISSLKTTNDWEKSIPWIVSIIGATLLLLKTASVIMPSPAGRDRLFMLVIFSLMAVAVIALCLLFQNWSMVKGSGVHAGAGVWMAILGAIICLAVNAVEIPAAMNEGTETD